MRVLVSLVAFVGGLWAGTEILRWSISGMTGQSEGRLEHLAVHGGDYDIIVVGSSFTRINFVPSVFDQRMAELGHPVTSFGLGINGMRGAEIHYYLDRILSLRLPRLKLILADVSLDQNALLNPDNGYQRRLIEWHDWTRFLLSVRHVFLRVPKWKDRIGILDAHVRYLLLNRCNVGAGLEALYRRIWIDGPDKIKPRDELVAGPWLAAGQGRRVERYLKRRAWHESAREKLKQERSVPATEPHSGFMQRAMRDLARRHHTRIAFTLAPILADMRFETEVAHDAPLEVIDFDDPAAYPDLYEPNMRYDKHLSYEGSVLLTRALADQVAARFYAKPGSSSSSSID
jgi:hypothetical protein